MTIIMSKMFLFSLSCNIYLNWNTVYKISNNIYLETKKEKTYKHIFLIIICMLIVFYTLPPCIYEYLIICTARHWIYWLHYHQLRELLYIFLRVWRVCSKCILHRIFRTHIYRYKYCTVSINIIKFTLEKQMMINGDDLDLCDFASTSPQRNNVSY